ncbi:hypothetical protein P167DRAFT_247404 [Morchella conica CCBAS932]|uniref:Uncharacterized protein n=1 Tax=Morchella conica CCBAS932 TaxID=1392247 RepID=A0A3N4KMK3_9PEZI|nr:hypothetical protein P167DRAFT_247404 [Morchella conica CCBAS932]
MIHSSLFFHICSDNCGDLDARSLLSPSFSHSLSFVLSCLEPGIDIYPASLLFYGRAVVTVVGSWERQGLAGNCAYISLPFFLFQISICFFAMFLFFFSLYKEFIFFFSCLGN